MHTYIGSRECGLSVRAGMYRYIYIYIYVCIYTYIHAYIHIYMHTYSLKGMWAERQGGPVQLTPTEEKHKLEEQVRICINIYVCVYHIHMLPIHTYIHTYIRACVRTYRHTHACYKEFLFCFRCKSREHTYIHKYIHTYINMHKNIHMISKFVFFHAD